MSVNKRTQKQIAERFQDNLDYYNRSHYWRKLRFWVTLLVTFAGFGLMIWFARESKQKGAFFNPGPLTQAHTTLENNCGACHSKAALPPRDALLSNTIHQIDQDCQSCHEQRGGFLTMHQPNATGESCSACHLEHVGPGPMPATSDTNCASCHNSESLMMAAEIKGTMFKPKDFPDFRQPGITYFPKTRPKNGYTKVFPSFWEGHPEFYFNQPGMKDPNPLRYNHSIHIRSPNIPKVNGQKLDCGYCHTPDRAGEGFIPVTFEKNCKECHALKFDSDFPDLNLPHADPSNVRSFLRGVETGTRYRDYAIIEKGKSAKEADQFAIENITKLRDRLAKQGIANMAEFEKLAFFGDGKNRPELPSCNYCHVVTQPPGNATPQISQTKTWDRFFQNGKFDHGKHTHMSCVSCHDAEESRLTSDLILPSVQSCAECHSPKGFGPKSGVAHDCSFCHQYHAPAPLKNVRADSTGVRDFLLAK